MKLTFLTTFFHNFNKFLTILKCSVYLNFEFNVTVDSMNSNSYVFDFYSLVQVTRLNLLQGFNS